MDGIGVIIFLLFIVYLLYLVVSKSIRIVHQGSFMIVERFGKYQVGIDLIMCAYMTRER